MSFLQNCPSAPVTLNDNVSINFDHSDLPAGVTPMVTLISGSPGEISNGSYSYDAATPGSVVVEFERCYSGAIHDCLGINLVDAINSYVCPDFTRQPDIIFNSLEDLEAQINSQTDHGGAVYQLAGGNYNTTNSNGIRLWDKQNLSLYSDPANPARLNANGLNFAITTRENSGGVVDNIEIIGFEVFNARFHGIFLGQDSSTIEGGSNILVAKNIVHNTGSAGIVVRNSATGRGPITVECNEIYEIDPSGTGSGRGEGIYIGQGSGNLFSTDVIIRGNYIHDLTGEGIDIKRESKNILVEYNRLDNLKVYSQGAITGAIDKLVPVNYDHDITIRRNVISNVESLHPNGADGNGIVVGGNMLVEENLIFNTHGPAIDVYNDANGPVDDVFIRRNILWNHGGVAIRENIGTGNGGPNDPFNVIRDSNIMAAGVGATAEDCEVTADYFQGALNSLEGFQPADGSQICDTAACSFVVEGEDQCDTSKVVANASIDASGAQVVTLTNNAPNQVIARLNGTDYALSPAGTAGSTSPSIPWSDPKICITVRCP